MKGYSALSGDYLGTFTAIRFGDGTLGYQSTGPGGELLGILGSNGVYGDAFAGQNRTWEVCEETDAHRKILARASEEWRSDAISFER